MQTASKAVSQSQVNIGLGFILCHTTSPSTTEDTKAGQTQSPHPKATPSTPHHLLVPLGLAGLARKNHSMLCPDNKVRLTVPLALKPQASSLRHKASEVSSRTTSRHQDHAKLRDSGLPRSPASSISIPAHTQSHQTPSTSLHLPHHPALLAWQTACKCSPGLMDIAQPLAGSPHHQGLSWAATCCTLPCYS